MQIISKTFNLLSVTLQKNALLSYRFSANQENKYSIQFNSILFAIKVLRFKVFIEKVIAK